MGRKPAGSPIEGIDKSHEVSKGQSMGFILGNPFLRILTEPLVGVVGMAFEGRNPQPAYNREPTRFSRDRCHLLIRFLMLLALGASVFQMGMFVFYYRPSYLLILVALFIISAIILLIALKDFRSILKLRSESKR